MENSKEIIDASTNESKIGDSTLFKTIEVDLVTTRQSEVEDKVSKHLVGLSFEQLGKYYENYIQNLPVDEVSRGLQTINIVSFSKEQVVVEKIYDASKVGYYIVDKLGEIKVYYNDKRTLYENTGIITSELPKSEKDVLEDYLLKNERNNLNGNRYGCRFLRFYVFLWGTAKLILKSTVKGTDRIKPTFTYAKGNRLTVF
jgi:hypothetical protein